MISEKNIYFSPVANWNLLHIKENKSDHQVQANPGKLI